MKKQKTTTTFICDECEKEEVSESFPYGKGWVYLYNFNTQIFDKSGNQLPVIHMRIEEKDRHFCSIKCEIEWLKKLLNGTLKIKRICRGVIDISGCPKGIGGSCVFEEVVINREYIEANRPTDCKVDLDELRMHLEER